MPRINIAELCDDLSLDMLMYLDPTVRKDTWKSSTHVPVTDGSTSDRGYWHVCDSASKKRLAIEQDTVDALVSMPLTDGEVVPQEHHLRPSDDANNAADDEASRSNKLMPNAFKIPGLKHICDNMLGAVLTSLPQTLVYDFESGGGWQQITEKNNKAIESNNN